MENVSEKEKEIILRIFKDLASYYNANSISKLVGMSRVGAYKALKNLERMGVIESRKLGRAIFYMIKKEGYAQKNVELLLMEEAKTKNRWMEEFKELKDLCESVVLFGSILKSEETANDIDILLIFKAENNKKINQIIEFKNKLLIKKVHAIKQTKDDFINNIRKKDKVVLSAISTGVVLFGAENYFEMIKNAANRQ